MIEPRATRRAVVEFLAHFRNPLVIILLLASGVSALTGDATSSLIIAAIVCMSVTLDFVQEHRAGRAAEQLKHSVAVRASVLRDGAARDVPVEDVVPGDVALLAAGDLIPADGRMLDARDFFVNQALLTGEPFPVEKHAGDIAPAAGMDGATNAVFMGTSVISGTARVLICATGPETMLGAIGQSLGRPAPPTAFARGTRQFSLLIMRLTVMLVLFVVLANAVFHRPIIESLLFAVALAVGLTPELLPMVISVTLSRGALRMAAQRVIVKRPAAIQDLGGMDVLCTDKTGTLTESRIRLERHLDAGGRDSRRVLELAYLNSFFESGLRSPLDDAILEHREIDPRSWRRIDEVPFDFERRRVSVLLERGQERWLVVKGAPEEILRLCTRCEMEGAGDRRPLDAAAMATAQGVFEAQSRDGFRVLGIAWRPVGRDHAHAVVTDETELIFAGFCAFLDPPKTSAGEALGRLAASGVSVKIVTGDNELVTRHVCESLHVPVTGMLLGTEIARMDDDALAARVESTNLFCRVAPAQKNRVIRALRARGHVVGYLGDGINDAPSMHSADVGISVEGAVDVAKEAAALIMLDRDLNVLHDGVLEGRRTHANIMKYIMMGTSSNFGNMFSMAGAVLVLPFLPMLPTQILLNNLLYDVSELPIPLDTVDAEDVARPRVWDIALVRNFMMIVGPVSSVFDFLMFYILIAAFSAHEALFHTGWFVESIATQVLVVFVIRTRRNPLRSRPHRLLIATAVAVVATAILLPFTPLGPRLGFVPLPPVFFAILIATVSAYLAAVAGVTRWFHARFAAR